MAEWLGVLIAIVSSSLGGTTAAVTRYLVSDADAVTGVLHAALSSASNVIWLIQDLPAHDIGSSEVRTQNLSGGDMQALLTAIVVWLSASFDLPAIHDYPHIEFVPAAQMAAERYKFLLPGQRQDIAAANSDSNRPDTMAFYNDVTKTIYLPNGWAGRTPAEFSILVHEMVHHLQNLAKLTHECPQAREKLAYQAQNKWLGLFGTDLEHEFEIDGFTLLAKTACMG